MKILITGSSGMVGKNIVHHSYFQNHELLTPRHAEVDLCNYQSVLEYFKVHRPDFVIHCAGRVGGIQANMKNPVSFLVENMDMGRNVLMAAREAGVKRLINLGSSCMYPRLCQNPIKEELVLQGELEPTNEGYAIAKIATARLGQYISRENPEYMYKTLIPCNLYGYYDKFGEQHSHMIPAVIKKILEAKEKNAPTVEIWGDGEARREFMFSGDLADFVAYAIQNFEGMPEMINVGLGHDYTINQYYQKIADVVGYQGKFTHDLSKPVGMKQKLVDTAKLNEFGWKYKTSLEEGIRQTVEYYKKEVMSHG